MGSVFYPSEADTVKEYGVSLKLHLEKVCSTQQLLRAAHHPFEKGGSIRPIQCRRYIERLQDLRQLAQITCSFLTKKTNLPFVFYALRHTLLPGLYCIKENAYILIRHLEKYRLYPPLEDEIVVRDAIHDSYQTLLSSLIEIELQTQPILDESIFQCRQLLCFSKGLC